MRNVTGITKTALGTVLALALVLMAGAAAAEVLSPKELLGKKLYFDRNLSSSDTQSCADCHLPTAGFAEPDQNLPVSQGDDDTAVGGRNAPSAAYAAFSPVFHYDYDEGLYVGGQFWDGRAATLADQAKGPFLNTVEMAATMPQTKADVVYAVQDADYAALFLAVYGPDAFLDIETAYDNIADAIAAFESSGEINTFSSKFDAFAAGGKKLTKMEQQGLELFNGKALCNLCHISESADGVTPALFTDFTYDNLGVPANPELIALGFTDPDLGLGGFYPGEEGKHKVPTLRNIAATAPYMHNGVFKTLKDVVSFYNTRDVADWPAPEVAVNVNVDELGNLGLSAYEEDCLVAFMETLTDGYTFTGKGKANGKN